MAQISTAEVARTYHKSRRHIIRLAKSGDLPHTKFPGKTGSYVFDSEQVAEAFGLLEQRKNRASA